MLDVSLRSWDMVFGMWQLRQVGWQARHGFLPFLPSFLISFVLSLLWFGYRCLLFGCVAALCTILGDVLIQFCDICTSYVEFPNPR